MPVTSGDEVGQMAAAAEATRVSMRDVLGQVGQASSSVAAASEELSTTSAQLGANAESASRQLSTVTEDISHRVEQIQVDTQASVAAISQISGIIARINDTQSTIASAVEEQTATTNEMGRNVHEASSESTAITANIVEVNRTSSESTHAAAATAQAASGLAERAAQLQSLVGRFVL